MNPYIYAVPAFMVICAGTVAVHAIRKQSSDAQLYQLTRPEMAERLYPFSSYVDADKLLETIGGFKGLVDIYRAAGAIATLVGRHAHQNGPSEIVEKMFLAAICARLLALLSMPEYWFRKSVPAWPPMFASALVMLFCHMSAILEATQTPA